MNQGRFITRSARYWPDHPAIIFNGKVTTFQELDERSSRLANALLALGAKKGDRIAIQAWNTPEIIELECALYKAGLVKVALNARLSQPEVIDTITNAQPVIMLAGPAHVSTIAGLQSSLGAISQFIAIGTEHEGFLQYENVLRDAMTSNPDIDMQADDLAVLHYTSGSTGKLKAAMQTVGNRMASLRKVVMSRMRVGPGDVLALAGPITHASGMFIQPFLFQGGAVLLHERFEPEAFLASVEKYRVTMCFAVPTMINMLVAHPQVRNFDLSSLKQISYGSAPMAPARIKEAWEVLGPVLSQGYGAGETTGGLVALSTEDHREAIDGGKEKLLGSCGRVFSESELKLVDDDGNDVPLGAIGEIVVCGPEVFAGYWREPELTAAAIKDGWLHTGDLARMDERGYLYIVDRKKDMIISGGFNVYPTEIEQVMYRHPAVYEVCVVGVPDEVWGESIKAVVVLRDGHTATETDMIEHCRTHLADFKKPRSIEFISELPKNANGKLSRKDVKERYWRGQTRRVA